MVLEETIRNLKKKYPASLKDLAVLVDRMEMVRASSGAACPVPLPDDDQHVLQAAIAGRADILVTGDIKDFGPFMNKARQTGGVLILTFAQFIDHEFKVL